MLTKAYVKSRHTWKVTFRLPTSECPKDLVIKNISLAGDFNNWQPSEAPMILRHDIYSVTLELEPGRHYQFRYLINDEVWWNDWHADGYVMNAYGTDDCILILPIPDK